MFMFRFLKKLKNLFSIGSKKKKNKDASIYPMF